LKLTVAKFYRISGGSTQHKGVSPDISIPSLIDTATIGEDTYTSSLPWSTISKTFYRPVSAISQNEIGRLRQSYQTGVIKERTSREYVRDLGILNRIRKRKTVSLSEAAFKAENEELKRIEKRWMNEDDSLKEKSYYDFMLNRSADIMNDLIGIKKSGQAGSPARRMLSLN